MLKTTAVERSRQTTPDLSPVRAGDDARPLTCARWRRRFCEARRRSSASRSRRTPPDCAPGGASRTTSPRTRGCASVASTATERGENEHPGAAGGVVGGEGGVSLGQERC